MIIIIYLPAILSISDTRWDLIFRSSGESLKKNRKHTIILRIVIYPNLQPISLYIYVIPEQPKEKNNWDQKILYKSQSTIRYLAIIAIKGHMVYEMITTIDWSECWKHNIRWKFFKWFANYSVPKPRKF